MAKPALKPTAMSSALKTSDTSYPAKFHIAGADETILFIARDEFEANQIGLAFIAGFEEGSYCNPQKKANKNEMVAVRDAIQRIRAGLANPSESGLFIQQKRGILKELRDVVAKATSAFTEEVCASRNGRTGNASSQQGEVTCEKPASAQVASAPSKKTVSATQSSHRSSSSISNTRRMTGSMGPVTRSSRKAR